MGICSHALYSALVKDLGSQVPGFVPGEPWPGMTPRQFAAGPFKYILQEICR